MSLAINNITFGYGIRRSKRIFNDFSGEIRKGSITALLGSNGTGKTTLLKLCCGLLVPTSGTVETANSKISSREKQALAEIFFVPDTLVLPAVNAKTFVSLNKPFYKSFSESLFYSLLDRFRVKPDVKFTSMSFGQQKKAYLAFAFAARTSYLLLDEPTNGLDPQSMEELKRIIAELASEDNSIVVSTHHLKDIENLCDDFMILDEEHGLHHISLPELTGKYHFGVTDGIPAESIYFEENFGRSVFIRKRIEGEPESVFNIGLYMNAVISKKIN